MLKRLFVILFNLILLFTLAGCSSDDISLNFAGSTTAVSGETFEKTAANEYDSTDVAIVTAISTQRKAITFYNLDLKKSYTLSYDSATRFADSYNTAVTVSQVKAGTLVEILFDKSGKRLVSLKGSQDCFVMSDVTGFSIDSHGVFHYKSENFEITDATILVSRDQEMSIEDLSAIDTLTLVGRDTVLYSIIVDVGHGYLSLTQHENLIGGYIEISNKQIERITEKMLLTIPEGKYTVRIEKNTTVAEKEIEIVANKETVLSLGDIELPEMKSGKVLFECTPENLTLYIDGKRVDQTGIQVLGYGRHLLKAEAEGYDTITRYFKVAEEMATLPVTLEGNGSSTDEDASEGATESPTDGYFVYVNSPADVEVYIDGYYVGMAPVMVVKSAGTHTISLRKSGYETRSYDVAIKDEEGDVTYTFDDLVAITTSTETSSDSGAGASE